MQNKDNVNPFKRLYMVKSQMYSMNSCSSITDPSLWYMPYPDYGMCFFPSVFVVPNTSPPVQFKMPHITSAASVGSLLSFSNPISLSLINWEKC